MKILMVVLSYRVDRIFKLIISKGHYSAKKCNRSYGSYSLHVV